MHDYRQKFEVMLSDEHYRIVRRKNSSGWNSSRVGDALRRNRGGIKHTPVVGRDRR